MPHKTYNTPKRKCVVKVSTVSPLIFFSPSSIANMCVLLL